MLTKTTRAGIQVLLYLSMEPAGEPASPRSMAGALGCSPTYLAKVAGQLVRAGILRAHKGAKGGVTLGRPTARITLLEIVQALQGPVLADYCPTLKSPNGVIQFNTPTIYSGVKFENIRLELKDGRIHRATGSNERRLNEILDTDPGARYIGEFSLGFNPYIENPMCDILFDEKIAGSLHFTPGQAYEDCGNGNKSAVHWDMVLIQRPEWGGGEVWFDGELIRKDGKFLPKDLRGLNPENLRD